ncbi:MAG: thioredoxin [Clostridiales Family XIII bacterium]|jgi:hypothetical protein|nr:thioredoxin [Clostridiales Family XIII bacterium]
MMAKTVTRFACLALALLFVALGVANGEMQAVFRKAIRICLECIGIG